MNNSRFRDEALFIGQYSDKTHGLETTMQGRWYGDKGNRDGVKVEIAKVTKTNANKKIKTRTGARLFSLYSK